MKSLFPSLLFLATLLVAGAQSSVNAQSNPTNAGNQSLEYRIENNEVLSDNKLYFKPGTAEILPESLAQLNTIKKFLADKAYVSVLRVEGHLTSGDEAQTLSEKRALAVCKWLVANGTDCTRVVPVGFGCNKPIVQGNKEENARIVFVIAALRGHAIGGMPVDGGGKVAGDACK